MRNDHDLMQQLDQWIRDHAEAERCRYLLTRGQQDSMAKKSPDDARALARKLVSGKQ